jgi:hypothetical protein
VIGEVTVRSRSRLKCWASCVSATTVRERLTGSCWPVGPSHDAVACDLSCGCGLDAKTASASSELPASEEGNGESEPENGPPRNPQNVEAQGWRRLADSASAKKCAETPRMAEVQAGLHEDCGVSFQSVRLLNIPKAAARAYK